MSFLNLEPFWKSQITLPIGLENFNHFISNSVQSSALSQPCFTFSNHSTPTVQLSRVWRRQPRDGSNKVEKITITGEMTTKAQLCATAMSPNMDVSACVPTYLHHYHYHYPSLCHYFHHPARRQTSSWPHTYGPLRAQSMLKLAFDF